MRKIWQSAPGNLQISSAERRGTVPATSVFGGKKDWRLAPRRLFGRRHASIQPRTGVSEIATGGCSGDAHRFTRLLDGKATEVSKDDQFGFHRIFLLEVLQRLI